MSTLSKTIWTSRTPGWTGWALMMAMIFLLPGTAQAWWNDDWSFRKPLAVDASPSGVVLPGDAGRMPILIRLHDGNFKFPDAKPDGSDLRFIAEDDKTPLHFHLEKYDSTFDLAFVWVDLPNVKAGAATHFWMYYGNKNAAAAQDAKGTYDSSSVLVYHFDGTDRPAQDQTAYANNALTEVRGDDATLIGGGVKFDGASAISLPASPSLAVAAGGQLTWSAWVKPDPDKPDGIFYAKADGASDFIVGLGQGGPFVAVSGPTGALRTGQLPAITDGKWHHIAVTAADKVTLYVDGQAQSILTVSLPALSGGASLGAALAAPTPDGVPPAPSTPATIEAGTGFSGEMDEVEISKAARTPGWIAAAASSQGTDGKLVSYGQDESSSSGGSGFIGVILGSVTIDGWVVIGLLMVMAVISWIVMVAKGRHVWVSTRANDAFLAFFHGGPDDKALLQRMALDRATASELTASKFTETQRRLATTSALFHLYAAGLDELVQRFPGGGWSGGVLSSHAIESIRAALDSQAVREIQALNDRMVLLTIAISGGPFLGLLGTVLGVMITFASIAASGDVNINAIAPGIAAALAATVAGLIVAIPSLFGYNYLTVRIKDLTASQQVFLDTLVARMAESSGLLPGPGPSQVAE